MFVCDRSVRVGESQSNNFSWNIVKKASETLLVWHVNNQRNLGKEHFVFPPVIYKIGNFFHLWEIQEQCLFWSKIQDGQKPHYEFSKLGCSIPASKGRDQISGVLYPNWHNTVQENACEHFLRFLCTGTQRFRYHKSPCVDPYPSAAQKYIPHLRFRAYWKPLRAMLSCDFPISAELYLGKDSEKDWRPVNSDSEFPDSRRKTI